MGHSSKISFHEKDLGTSKKTFSVYFTGFVLCLILTFIPFMSVIHKIASNQVLMLILLVTAILQFLVQVICFLRLNNKTEQSKMNTLSFVFTGVVAVVVIGGSLWIMGNLNYFMMH